MEWVTVLEWGGIGLFITGLASLLIGWMKGKQDGRRLAQDMLVSALDRANSEIDRLVNRVQLLEDGREDQVLILTHLESLHSWIDRGAKEPYPMRPAWLIPGPFSPLGGARSRPKAEAKPVEVDTNRTKDGVPME